MAKADLGIRPVELQKRGSRTVYRSTAHDSRPHPTLDFVAQSYVSCRMFCTSVP